MVRVRVRNIWKRTKGNMNDFYTIVLQTYSFFILILRNQIEKGYLTITIKQLHFIMHNFKEQFPFFHF